MEKTISSINTIKYLDHNGDYQIKIPGAKSFKTYKFTYKKENISDTKKNLRKQISEYKDKLDVLIKSYQKLFVQELKSEKDIAKKDKMLVEIKKLIDKITTLETVLISIASIPPHDMRYTDRQINLK